MNSIGKLKNVIREYDSILLPVSGGLDSTFLLFFVKKNFPKKKILAIHFYGDTFYEEDGEFLRELCIDLKVELIFEGLNHLLIEGIEGKDRCLNCKREMFERLKKIMVEKKLKWIFSSEVFGENFENRKGFRFLKGKNEVIFPLLETGVSKGDILKYFEENGCRELVRTKNSCILTRFKVGKKIKSEDIKKIKECERWLKDFGINGVVRVRMGDVGKCYLEFSKYEDKRKISGLLFNHKLINFFSDRGFDKIFINLKGYGEK